MANPRSLSVDPPVDLAAPPAEPSTHPATGSRRLPGRRTRLAARLGPLPRPLRRVLDNPLLEGLATPHGVSRYLEAIHPLWSLEGGKALVTDVHAETGDTVTLTLRPGHQWEGSRAGQHVRVGVEIDGTRHTRTYSVSSSQHRRDGQLTITVRRKDGGLVSGHLTTRTRPGDVVACSAATGDVVLPDPRPGRLLLVSGGSGITPLAAMLRTLADERHPGQVTFLHYARTHDDVAFAADLDRIADELPDTEVVVITTADGGREGTRSGERGTGGCGRVGGRRAPVGRFAPQHLADLVPDHLDVLTYVCGPAGLVDAVESHYTAAGAVDRLQVERFTAPPLQLAAGPGDGTVRFATSGLQRDDDGRSLLEQAESEGLEPEAGCRMGICRTCTRQKVSGGTIDLRNGRRSDTPDEQVQICVSVPAGDVVIDL